MFSKVFVRLKKGKSLCEMQILQDVKMSLKFDSERRENHFGSPEYQAAGFHLKGYVCFSAELYF